MEEMQGNIWPLIVSCLVLGAVLFRRRYWWYGFLCWIAAVFSYLYPIVVVSILPYLLTVSVCCVLGMCAYSASGTDQCNVADSNVGLINSPLYVGERTSTLLVKNNRIGTEITARVSQLEKKDEWIVAVKIPADNGPVKPDNPASGRPRRFSDNRYNYLVIQQAVSREIRRGLNSPLIVPDSDINQNYRMNHVGWYKHNSERNPDPPVIIRNFVSNAPMISGYPSNESAVDMALQVSNSTVYTHFKCMLSYRPHTFIKYLLLLLCSPVMPVMYQWLYCSQPIVTALPLMIPTSVAAVINFITGIEINMLQVGQQQKFPLIESILKIGRYYVALVKCVVHNLVVVFIVTGVIMATIYAENPYNERDQTKEPEAAGSKLVETVLIRIEAAKISEDDQMYNYLRRVARVESSDGLDDSTYRDGYHGGLWQVDEPLFLITQDNTSYPPLTDKHKLINDQFKVDWMTMQWRELRKPLWSGMAACLYMCAVGGKIPSSISKQAEHWNKNYNSKKEHPRRAGHRQKNLTEEFVGKVKGFEAQTSVCYKDMDLFIVLDSSGSIGEESYERAKKFVVDLISGFTISAKNVRIGLVVYSETPQLEFGLDYAFDQTVVLNKIRKIPYLNSRTATGDAIMLMVNNGFTEARGARPPKLAIPRVGIVLTDGNSNAGRDVRGAAQAARDKSIEMFAFGIGNEIKDKELLEIAGSQERKFRIDSFDNIDDVRALIARGSCKAGIKATMNKRYGDNLDTGKSRLFEYEVPKEGITLQVQIEGKITLFGSHKNPDPSPVWYEYVLTGIHGDWEIPISYPTVDDRKQNEPIPLYCNLVGVENSTFSINAVKGTD